jgi:hypothetical protein
MRAGKKTYINVMTKIIKDRYGFKEIPTRYKFGSQLESVYFSIDGYLELNISYEPYIDIDISYEPYKDHIFKILLQTNIDYESSLDEFVLEYSNLYMEPAKKEFETKEAFEKYLEDIVTEFVEPTLEKVEIELMNLIDEMVRSGKKSQLNQFAKPEWAEYFEKKLTSEQIMKIYEVTGYEDYLDKDIKDLFIF